MKTCPACGEMKPLTDFYGKPEKPSGHCKECHKARARARYAADPKKHHDRHRAYVQANPERIRAHKIKAAYGLTEEEYDALPKVCFICGTKDDLCVDHSHATGRVRGILCNPHNKALGFFKDDVTMVLRAADYLLGNAKPDIFEATYERVEDTNA